MKLSILLSCSLLATTLYGNAKGQDASEIVWDGQSSMDGHDWYIYEITLRELRKAPVWDSESGAKIPLGALKAIRIARRHLAAHVKKPSDYPFKNLKLESLRSEKRKVYWGWVVQFDNGTPRIGTGVPAPAEITVLMNGFCPTYRRAHPNECGPAIVPEPKPEGDGEDEAAHKQRAEQDGADQPATAPESKAEGEDKPKPESKGRFQ